MTAKPTRRLQQETPIAVAIVHDRGSVLAPVPSSLARNIQETLARRNLQMQPIAQAAFENDFVRKRASRDRFQSISSKSAGAQLLLLLETRAEYYSQLNGRYRWTVYVKISISKAGSNEADSVSEFTVPVMLNFDHQREDDALAYAAPTIASKVGKEIDDYVAGLDLATLASDAPPATPEAGSKSLGPMYFVMLDRFYNGNRANDGETDSDDPQAFHGGDIAGLTQKLDHIASMGFETIWLSPIFSMRTEKIGEHGAFHGYWTEDLRELEARFGTAEELATLRAELDKRGMNLVLDMVLNHVGYDTKMVVEHPDWFHHNGDIKQWEDPIEVTTFDVHGLPDLAQEKAPVYDFLLSASAHWIELLHPVGFRLDAVKHVSNEFWQRYTKAVRSEAGQGFATIGELYHGDPKVIAKGFAEGGFSHLFDFPLYFSMKDTFCEGEHLGRLAATLSLDRLYPDANRLVTFADNHDVPRLWSACGKDGAKVRALLTFLLTARGIPSISYGTEVGLEGAGEPENRRDMRFDPDGALAPLLRDLLAARKAHEVLRVGTSRPLYLSKERYAYLRIGPNEVALIAVNMGADAWHVAEPGLQDAQGVDVLGGAAVDGGPVVAAGSVQVVLYPRPAVTLPQAASVATTVTLKASAEAEELLLVGAGPELGAWDPKQAIVGQKTAGGSFTFSIALGTDSIGVFKFVRKVGEDYQWEESGNRYLFAGATTDKPLRPTFSTGAEK